MPDDNIETDPEAGIIEETVGNLFDAPKNAVLIHACNCLGSWGAGIAKSFKAKYPAAYKVHKEYCQSTPDEALIGTCQLIAPQQEDYQKKGKGGNLRPASKQPGVGTSDKHNVATQEPDLKKHWIACLFTSVGYGKPTKQHPGMDKPDVILENTRKSLIDLKEQLLKLENNGSPEDRQLSSKETNSAAEEGPGQLWSCKFNSGLFAVDWADTRKVLEEELKSLRKSVRVVSPVKS